MKGSRERTDSVALNLKLGEVLCMCPDASHHQDAVEACVVAPHCISNKCCLAPGLGGFFGHRHLSLTFWELVLGLICVHLFAGAGIRER